MFRAANLALAFVVELAGLAALGWWGDEAGGIVLAIVFPLLAALLWGAFMAPKARRHVPAVGLAALVAVAAGLVEVGHPVLAAVFAVVAVANRFVTSTY